MKTGLEKLARSAAVVVALAAIPLAHAQTQPQTVFFAPLDGVYRPPLPASGGSGFSGSLDYPDLFTADAPWTNAASRVQVFQPYGQWIYAATDAQIAQMLT